MMAKKMKKLNEHWKRKRTKEKICTMEIHQKPQPKQNKKRPMKMLSFLSY